jgi:NitT/TauT family transport system substrate-binding protein
MSLKNLKELSLIAAVVAVAALALTPAASARVTDLRVTAGTSPATTADTRPRVLISTGIDAGYSIYYVAVSKGFLKKRGINASFRLFDSGPAAEEAVIAKQADVTQNAELPQQVPASRGADIQVVASSYHPTRNMCIMARPEIKTPEDLEGKTVTYLALSGGQYLWAVWATKHKLQAKVKTVSLAPPEMLPAMARGDVQAAAIWTPWCNLVTTVVPGGHVLAWPGADEGLYQPDNSVIFSGSLVRKPNVARAVLRALIDAALWINDNPTATANLIAPIIRQKPFDAETQLRGILPFRMKFDDEDVENFYQVAAWAKETKIVEYPQTSQQLMNKLLNPCLLRSAAPSRVTIKKYVRVWKCK